MTGAVQLARLSQDGYVQLILSQDFQLADLFVETESLLDQNLVMIKTRTQTMDVVQLVK